MKTKDELREEVRIKRRGLTPEWIGARSEQAQQRLMALRQFEEARAVALYLAFGAEVLTEAVLAHCRRTQRSVFVPAFDGEAGTYRLCALDETTALSRGQWGIAEPGEPRWATDETRIEFMVVPGLAFDRCGGRIGYGRGYYDRMTREPNVRHAWKAGLAFDFQVFDHVPTAAHDVPMDAVVTESRVFRREGV